MPLDDYEDEEDDLEEEPDLDDLAEIEDDESFGEEV